MLFLALHGANVHADPAVEKPAARPVELSLRSLFHPEEKHEFVSPLPKTRWIDGDDPVLLIRRDKAWMQWDRQSGRESVWPVFEQLTDQLASLQGVSDAQRLEAALAAVADMERPQESLLVTIDGALAIVSATTPARWLTRDAKHWQNATLGPQGRIVAYNSDGDLFLMDASGGRTVRLTADGTETLLDGILDWTYQEEIFGRGNYKGFWFSPDGQWLAMLRIDISGIAPYTLAAAASDRGKGIVRRYPKAGDPIPHASLLLWDLRQLDQGVIPRPRVLAESTPQQERIVTGVWWHEHRQALLLSISDRRQTWRELRIVDENGLLGTNDPAGRAGGPAVSGDGFSRLLLREASPAWVEPPVSPGWISDGSLVWRSALPSGLNRLYHLRADGTQVTPLSPADFDVHDFAVSSDGAAAIVTGNSTDRVAQRHAYRIDLGRDSEPTGELHAITPEPGWHDVTIGPRGRSFTDIYSSTTKPPELLVRSTADGQATSIDRAQLDLKTPLIRPELFRIPRNDGIGLPALVVRPAKASKKQPCGVVIEVYGGPQAPVVSTRWSDNRVLYRELLARRGIATLVVDNRSSAGHGIADTWAVRGRLGEIEFADLMIAVDWLKSQPWVDPDRLAIRGWSFGGFLTLYAMTHSDAFAAGIAGGSVTDWREYDAFYTERYMDLPTKNPAGYRDTAPINAAADLRGRVLLIHGESDDNVHPSGTMRMAGALQRAGKDFELMIYPGAAHAITDRWQVWHMAQMTDRFLTENLLPASN